MHRKLDNSTKWIMFNLQTSDIIYKQFTNSYMPLNILIIIMQFLTTILSVILQNFTSIPCTLIGALFNMILLFVVLANNAIHSKAWNKAKSDMKFVNKLFDSLYYNDDEHEKIFNDACKSKFPSLYLNDDKK